MTSSTPRSIELVPLLQIVPETQDKVRHIRNEQGVRIWMFSDHIITESEHRAWLEGLQSNSKQIVFAILDDNQAPLGVVSINALDRVHLKSDWAFYLTGDSRGGMGAVIEFAFIDFAFQVLGLEKLNCEVLEGNNAVVTLHKKFAFAEEGFRRSNIKRDGERLGVHLLGLQQNEWNANKNLIYDKYKSLFDRFKVTIRWTSS
ncbi:UDP-4-amino-4,6-dideoxy-N-acetyl-beta-L-altrosamine N-acetyltransferase [Bremerella alba]|nr:UDP-4-amino-4,6-dideoxy-N-acetyl-beta-L-altrosamine N-acetyltransferase [Bremerella alba]